MSHRITRFDIDPCPLEQENKALRDELLKQWEYNHSENCGSEWPHRSKRRCHWPLPEILNPKKGPMESNGVSLTPESL
jgi:hypothetical protein